MSDRATRSGDLNSTYARSNDVQDIARPAADSGKSNSFNQRLPKRGRKET